MQDAEVLGTILHRFRDSSNEHNAIDALVRIASAIESHTQAINNPAEAHWRLAQEVRASR
jgi:hypothetical protein